MKTKVSKSNNKTLKKAFYYVGKYRFFVPISLALALVSVVLSLLIPVVIGKAIDLITTQGNVDIEGIISLLLITLILVGISAVVQWIMGAVNNVIAHKICRDIRNEAFTKLKKLPISCVDKTPHGDIVNRIINDTDRFCEGLFLGFTQVFTGILTIVGTLGFMIFINAPIAIVVVLLTPLSIFISNFIGKRTFKMFKERSETEAEQSSFIDEYLGNQKIVKAFNKESQSLNNFDEIGERLEKSTLKAIFFSSLVNPTTRFVNSVVYAAVALVGSIMIISGEWLGTSLTVGSFAVLLSYTNQYTKPFNEISGIIAEFQNALASAERVFGLIEEKEQNSDKSSKDLSSVSGNVTLTDVEFSYNKEKPLIENLNLSATKGQRVAIVGPTGCGKTTIINLLMRFYDIDSGRITVDGEDIREVSRKSLRTSYGMVLQDTWIKSGTVMDNIRFGKADATEEEVILASKAAHAHSFIKRLTNGYNTKIGEGGEELSQGQKQLICIARVMLSLPPMLILDEATSSIDTRTEMRIQKAFTKMMEGRTSFIVAHRLSTIQEADVILVMKDGKIIETGKHEELLKKQGFYYELYNSQFAN